MNLKQVVAFSLIVFVASMSLILVAGLVLTHQKPAGVGSTAGSSASPAARSAVYCGGKTPCYGKSALAAHADAGSCWGYNLDWVINLTGYAPVHPVGPKYVVNDEFCGKDVHGALAGTVTVGYSHAHQDVTQTNGAGSILTSYRVGYYDANKP